MKKRSFFPFLPGLLLLCLGLLLSWTCANASPRLLFPSEEALTLPEDFFHSFAAGDPEAAGSMLVGQPRLTFRQPEDSPMSDLLWDAYLDSLRFEFQEGLTVTDSGLSRNVTVTGLDIPALMEQLKKAAPSLLAREAAAIGEDQAFGKDNHYRQDFVTDTLYRGTRNLLKGTVPTATREYRLEMVRRDGTWQILPDQALLDLLCGTIA